MFKKITFTALAGLLLINCGGASTTSSLTGSAAEDDDNSYSGSNLEGGNIATVTFNASNQASINVGTVSESAEYVLALYSYNEEGDTIGYQLGASLASALPKALSRNEESITEDFHELLRDAEQDLNPEHSLNKAHNQTKAVIKKATVGDTRTFKVLNSFSGGSSYASVTAELRFQTSNFNAYIDQRNENSLTESDIQSLCENFDSVIAEERELFGEESDIDSDGRFNILFTQEVNELGGSAGGIITGFFYAVDLFDDSIYSQSNETEIFYTFVPDPEGDFGVAISKEFALSNILPSVLPHEFQHMINFNNHYLLNDGSPEYSYLNEGLSHLAEDIYSLDENNYMAETGIENPARVQGYLASIDSICITCGSSLYQRGGSYLLLRYLYEQAEKGNLTGSASGLELINNLVQTDKIGEDNIVYAAYATTDVEEAFTDIMGQFGLAVFLSNTGLTSDDRLGFEGINLRTTQDDNRGTVLQGPGLTELTAFPTTDTVGGSSISFVRVTGSQINEQDGVLDLTATDGYSVGAYLIQTGL